VSPALSPAQLRTLGWFGLSGVVGFVVDAGLLHLLVSYWNINLYLARACSFICAATTTWLLNRFFTFAAPRRPARRLLAEWAAYFTASLGGGALNYLVFVIAVWLSPWLHQTPTIAVALATLVSMTFNFLVYARYVFRPQAKRPSGS